MERRPLEVPRPDCTSVVLDGRISVHCPDTGTVHTLSTTATSVWQLLDGALTLDEVVDQLADAYGASTAVVRKDVLAVVAEFGRSHLLTQTHQTRT